MTPEEQARVNIDTLLEKCGWVVQDRAKANLHASLGVALRELNFTTGEPDYTLFVEGKAICIVEAKPVGHSLVGVEEQTSKYVRGVPEGLPAWRDSLPFGYETTGVETQFTNFLDATPRSRNVFAFHRPESLKEWATSNNQLTHRLAKFPTLITDALWKPQIEAITNLEHSFKQDKPKALIQMATGSGKTFTAVNFIYRLIKHGGAKRVLFLVDRGNLGAQTLKEFQQFQSPETPHKFTNEYIVQHLKSNTLDTSSRVVISTIQRLFSMLKGEEDAPEDLDDLNIESVGSLYDEPVPIEYNPSFPIEAFDFIVTDECHRSIYNLWRQVLEYFDARIIGLTATPSKQTFGFFDQNLVMEYGHDKAVADGVNVNFDVYQIKTAITESGGEIPAGFYVDKRNKLTRKKRWEQLDEVLDYEAKQLDRDVVAEDQIRTVLQTFKDKLFTEIFPGRKDVPKTLIFAKDDSHADDIVKMCRDVFGKGNDFCKKITYRTTGEKPADLIQSFRNSYNPRVVVTVDMIATGTDIKPLEIVFFMRSVKSRSFFEQMKGRGVRVISEGEMSQVNPGITKKTRFVIVDAVGVCERDKGDSRPLEKKKSIPTQKLLEAIALGNREPAMLESLAGRLIKFERRLDKPMQDEVLQVSQGQSLSQIASGLLEALDPDVIDERSRQGLAQYEQPDEEAIKKAREELTNEAAKPLASNPDLRNLLIKIQQTADMVIDVITKDQVLYAGPADETVQDAAKMVTSFRDYLEQNKAEITALQILYSRPYSQRLTEGMLKELESKLRQNHAAWTEDRLWDAFRIENGDVVKGQSQVGRFADLVSLVHFALEQQPVLEPFSNSVHARFDNWIANRIASGEPFTPEQFGWLASIRDHIATSVSIDMTDFDLAPFVQQGGRAKAYQLFGDDLAGLLAELNKELVA